MESFIRIPEVLTITVHLLLSGRPWAPLRGFVGSQHMVAMSWGYSLRYQGMVSMVTRGSTFSGRLDSPCLTRM